MKDYITWKPKKIDEDYNMFPNTSGYLNNKTNGLVVLTDTPYQDSGLYLGVIEYPSMESFNGIDEEFNFTIITEGEANEFLKTFGDVTVKDFMFTDNRILEVI